MCGIAGIVGLDSSESKLLIDEMTSKLKHRGPNASMTYIYGKIAFGHRRLSIIDLSQGANQPFHDADERYTIVFNGEIYNYEDVRAKLNYPWKTHSDTEVILAAYMQWGRDCLNQFRGMFAFAIWDKKENELFMARDRFGVKPFYYHHQGDLFIFCSEIRAMLSTGLIQRKLDRQSLEQYLSYMAVRSPKTIIRDVFQLNPGHCAVYKDGVFSASAYWNIEEGSGNTEAYSLNYSETIKKTRQLFEDSIRNRMVADVKVGAFLSGGIDSSAVVAVMSKFSTAPVQTYSIVFDDKKFDESEYSRLISRRFNTKHTELKLHPSELISDLPSYIRDMDVPTVDGINSYTVSKLVAKTGIKVVLSGIGGDELFAGYPNFKRWKKYNRFRYVMHSSFFRKLIGFLSGISKSRAALKISDLLESKQSGLKTFYNNSRRIFLKRELNELLISEQEPEQPDWIDLDQQRVAEYPVLSRYSIAELTHYTFDILLKDTDQMSMAWALEAREPFFDHHLVDFVLRVPDKFKYSAKTPKSLLVNALAELLPDEVVYRPKKGFTFPWENWLRNELKTVCEESISNLGNSGYFKPAALDKLWKQFTAGSSNVTWVHIWSLVILEKWLSQNEIEF